jgi:hypothetical protein
MVAARRHTLFGAWAGCEVHRPRTSNPTAEPRRVFKLQRLHAASPRAHTGNRHQHGRGEDVVGATNRLLPETFQWCSIAGVAPLSHDVRAPTAPSSISPSWVATTAERAVIAITRNERAEPEPRSRCRVWHPVESVHHHADPWQRAMDSTSDTRNERVEPER